MNKCHFTVVFVLTTASMLLAFPSYSQDKDLLAKADSLNQLGRDLNEAERYEEAIVCLGAAANLQKKLLGEFSSEFADTWHLIGTCYGLLGDYPNALAHFLAVLSIRESISNKRNPDYINCLDDIGDCYYEIGDYTTATDYYQKELSLCKEMFGEKHSEYARCLDNIGDCYYKIGDYTKAIDCYKQVSLIRKTLYGEENRSYANSLSNIGDCYYKIGDYTKAIDCYKQVSLIRKSLFGEENGSYARSLTNLGNCYYNLDSYSQALKYYQLESSILLNLYGRDHPNIAWSFSDIGDCYLGLEDYNMALDYFKQALSIRETLLGKDHPDYASSLNSIGDCYLDLEDYGMALEYYQQALAIREIALGKKNLDYASNLSDIGFCYSSLGDYIKALDYFQQALAIREELLGKEHPDYASSLNRIGNCYRNLGEYSKALEFLEKYKTYSETLFGKDSLEYASAIYNIGICYRSLGNLTNAVGSIQQALQIMEKNYNKNVGYAHCLYGMGLCYFDKGEYDQAIPFFNSASPLFSYNSELYLASQLKIGVCYLNINKIAIATRIISSYSLTVSSFITNSFSSLTESQRASFWEKYQDFYTNRLYDYSATISSPQMNCSAYDGALLGKGLLLNAETEMRKLILESGDEEALRIYNEVQQSRVRLDKIYEDPVGKKEQIDSLNNDIEVRQQELMKRSKAFGDYTRNLALKWTDVQAALGKKDIAIEFETYTHQDTTFYIALTLRPGYTEPHLVELFNSTQMKAKSDSKTYYTSTAMSKLVWGNLAEELNGIKNVYFSPAGELNNIGIEYMLDEDGEHLLSEKRNYYRLTSTRELAKEYQAKKMSDATVYGGIRYDVTPGSKLTGEETESERLALAATRSYTPMDSLSLTRGGWNYLPGTKDEAESISSTLTSKRVKNELLEGEAGTEESFKSLGGARKDVIHIATHGFYWTETEAGRSGMETSSFMLDGESRAPKEDKALTRSGLLFAGAQNTFDGKELPIDVEDGILTAKDISRMDLRGTDLVVISACQSGLGEVTGDGVFGLQRGFKKAGVQSIVMSLWEVDDMATKIMMTRFYENLAKGKSKYDSFREAQKYLRKYEKCRYDEPEYYAAFVLLDAIE